MLVRSACRSWAAVLELGQGPVLDRDQPLIRAALLLDRAWQPRPGLALGPQGCQVLGLALARLRFRSGAR